MCRVPTKFRSTNSMLAFILPQYLRGMCEHENFLVQLMIPKMGIACSQRWGNVTPDPGSAMSHHEAGKSKYPAEQPPCNFFPSLWMMERQAVASFFPVLCFPFERKSKPLFPAFPAHGLKAAEVRTGWFSSRNLAPSVIKLDGQNLSSWVKFFLN